MTAGIEIVIRRFGMCHFLIADALQPNRHLADHLVTFAVEVAHFLGEIIGLLQERQHLLLKKLDQPVIAVLRRLESIGLAGT